MTLPAAGARSLMVAAEMRRSLARIAHEILERNHGAAGLIVLGIHSRGVPLARRLAVKMGELEGIAVPAGEVDVSMNRDDLAHRPTRPVRPTRIPADVTDAAVVLVDDVLYTGRTIRAAMDVLFGYGRPRSIQLACLIDRGHRELPIRADYVGKNVPSARSEEVRVQLTEIDGIDEVTIRQVER
jgi:pyrimidine operon attenuation protein/uracil phosphoribosyltransferase